MTGPVTSKFVIEPLGPAHDRKSFDCGVPALNTYLERQARQDLDRSVAVPYVLVPIDNPSTVAGFYTLSSTSVKLDGFPEQVSKKLPRYPAVPATLLGRLAVSANYRGQRLGERLLVDALHRSLAASESVASVAVVVDAKDESSANFSVSYGFTRFVDSPLRLFMTMKSIAASWPPPAPREAVQEPKQNAIRSV